jgi:hypothetical protein
MSEWLAEQLRDITGEEPDSETLARIVKQVTPDGGEAGSGKGYFRVTMGDNPAFAEGPFSTQGARMGHLFRDWDFGAPPSTKKRNCAVCSALEFCDLPWAQEERERRRASRPAHSSPFDFPDGPGSFYDAFLRGLTSPHASAMAGGATIDALKEAMDDPAVALWVESRIAQGLKGATQDEATAHWTEERIYTALLAYDHYRRQNSLVARAWRGFRRVFSFVASILFWLVLTLVVKPFLKALEFTLSALFWRQADQKHLKFCRAARWGTRFGRWFAYHGPHPIEWVQDDLPYWWRYGRPTFLTRDGWKWLPWNKGGNVSASEEVQEDDE